MPDFLVIRLNQANGLYEAVNGPNVNGTFTAIDGEDANGLAAIQTRINGKYVSFPETDAVATNTSVVQSAESVLTSF